MAFTTVIAAEDRDPNKTVSKTFSASYDDVWRACVRAASEDFKIENSDKETGTLKFRVRYVLNRFAVHVRLDRATNGVKVTAWHEFKKGVIGKDAGKNAVNRFLSEVESALSKPSNALPSS